MEKKGSHTYKADTMPTTDKQLIPEVSASDIIAAIHVLNETIRENRSLSDSIESRRIYNTDATIRQCNDNILILQEKLFVPQ